VVVVGVGCARAKGARAKGMWHGRRAEICVGSAVALSRLLAGLDGRRKRGPAGTHYSCMLGLGEVLFAVISLSPGAGEGGVALPAG
jgi:hypothetical protein